MAMVDLGRGVEHSHLVPMFVHLVLRVGQRADVEFGLERRGNLVHQAVPRRREDILDGDRLRRAARA